MAENNEAQNYAQLQRQKNLASRALGIQDAQNLLQNPNAANAAKFAAKQAGTKVLFALPGLLIALVGGFWGLVVILIVFVILVVVVAIGQAFGAI